MRQTVQEALDAFPIDVLTVPEAGKHMFIKRSNVSGALETATNKVSLGQPTCFSANEAEQKSLLQINMLCFKGP